MAAIIRLNQNQVLLREGETSTSMYWVQSGQLIVTKQRGKDEITLGHISSGELVGEISFLDQEPRSATVKALTECELVEIPIEAIEAIYRSQPKWLEVLVKTLSERLRKANARIKV